MSLPAIVARPSRFITIIALVICLLGFGRLYSNSVLGMLGNSSLDASSARLPTSTTKTKAPKVELVVSSISKENTSWIGEFFPQWPAKIYVADDPRAKYRVDKNLGKEGNIYLTYIIDHYHKLPDVVIFIHGRRYQWHNEDPLYDGVPVLQRFQIPYVLKHGFSTLRCSWLLGCPLEMSPHQDLDMRWDDPNADQRAKTEAAYAQAYLQLFPGKPIPTGVATHCGAQFAVTRERIQNRTLEDYKHYRNWLYTTELTDEFSGRVMEYSWHQIFGQPPIDCPPAGPCFCEKFGLCDLECEDYECAGRYYFKFGELPAKWPEEGPGTEDWPDRDWQRWVAPQWLVDRKGGQITLPLPVT